MAYLNTRASLARFKEECDRLEWKFRNGRLTREEVNKFCSVFAITHLTGWGSGGMPVVTVTFAVNATNSNLFTSAGSPGFPIDLRATVNSGIYISATSTATPGMDVGVGWSSGSVGLLTNRGQIIGKGGDGATDTGAGGISNGVTGGPALKLQAGLVLTIDNTGSYIAGGGGGGGGSSIVIYGYGPASAAGGGGAGGGNGGNSNYPPGPNFAGGGAGAGIGGTGGNGSNGGNTGLSSGGGGGGVLPGSGGTGSVCGGHTTGIATGGSAGGGGGNQVGFYGCSGSGGNGGSSNGAGGGAGWVGAGGGGGGWGAAGGGGGTSSPGGGGNCVVLNGQSIIFSVNGNRFGAIS